MRQVPGIRYQASDIRYPVPVIMIQVMGMLSLANNGVAGMASVNVNVLSLFEFTVHGNCIEFVCKVCGKFMSLDMFRDPLEQVDTLKCNKSGARLFQNEVSIK